MTLNEKTAHPVVLQNKNIGLLPSQVLRPQYQRQAIAAGIAHISLGAFHRSHQAVYTDDVLNAGGAENWGILGIGAMPSDDALCQSMLRQDCLYSVTARQDAQEEVRIVGAICDVALLPEHGAELVMRLGNPAIKIVSLTITEKGYCLDGVNGRLNATHPLILKELEQPQNPQSAISLIVAALDARRRAGIPPFTVMSCDNLPSNGHKARDVVIDYAALIDDSLSSWIAKEVAFPNTMVDRITPVMTAADGAALSRGYGIDDACPVVCEEFRQWVLEDNFSLGRPAWQDAGAQFVGDVYPYELAKIRLLNVSHSIFAYPAFLAGYEFVSDGAQDAVLAGFVRSVMDKEITPTLPPVPGMELNGYKARVIQRFANSAIKDRWERICSDGSQKIANQMMPIVRERMQSGQSCTGLAVAIASWVRYLQGEDESGKGFFISDPLTEILQKIARSTPRDPSGVLSVQAVFGVDILQHSAFVQSIREALHDFYDIGAKATLEKWSKKL